MNLDLHKQFFFFFKIHVSQRITCYNPTLVQTEQGQNLFAVNSGFNKQEFDILENTLIRFYCQKVLSCMSGMTVQPGAARPNQDRKQQETVKHHKSKI